VSSSGVVDTAGDQARAAGGIEESPGLPGGEDDLFVPASGGGRQPTGDHAVDEVLERLDNVASESLDTQIEVSEQVHRVLQSRLADLVKE
jgi:hypothetical protein